MLIFLLFSFCFCFCLFSFCLFFFFFFSSRRRHTRWNCDWSSDVCSSDLDERVISLPFAIRSSTSLPAETLGFKERGLLKTGFFADIAVFDPKAIRDSATYQHPRILAAGVRYLFVNGKLAVDNGRRTSILPGRVLIHR